MKDENAHLKDPDLDYSLDIKDYYNFFSKFNEIYNKFNNRYKIIEVLILILTIIASYIIMNNVDLLLNEVHTKPSLVYAAIISFMILLFALYTYRVVFRFNKRETREAQAIVKEIFLRNDMNGNIFVINNLLEYVKYFRGSMRSIGVSLIVSVIAGIVGTIHNNTNDLWNNNLDVLNSRPDRILTTFFIATFVIIDLLLIFYILFKVRNKNLFYESLQQMKMENSAKNPVKGQETTFDKLFKM